MLKRIALRDFVIVRELELDLSAGFSVLTGETGAGKSILVDALLIALGSRAEVIGALALALRSTDVPLRVDTDEDVDAAAGTA